MADEIKKIKRSEFASFLDTTPTASEPSWVRVGLGVTSQSIAYNPQTTTETDIHEDNARTSVDSYQPSIDTKMTAYAGEPIFDFVDELRRKRSVADDCKSHYLNVYMYDKNTDGSYPAELNECTIQISNFGGDGGKPVEIEYTIGLNGDPTLGTVTISAGKVTFKAGSQTGGSSALAGK